ncbi:MAG: hypothetical protein ACPLYX_05785 [Rectinema subterraneum]|uniref:hypothetical protein n=1 Tax=Rectinema subterraneum TaxID=2653714 RepID=UPI003C7D0FF9
MKSITIHSIDPDLDKKISEKSKELGLSQNRTVKAILQNALRSDNKAARREMFSDLFGKWTEKERGAFEKRIMDLEEVNDSDWAK